MQKEWIERNSTFLDHIWSKFSPSAKASLEAGEMIETEVDETMLPRFDTEEDTKAHVTGLKFWEQYSHSTTKGDYLKLSRITRHISSTVYVFLHSIYEVSLKSRLDAEPKF